MEYWFEYTLGKISKVKEKAIKVGIFTRYNPFPRYMFWTQFL